ncbi:DUF4192 domain-containing protein [Nocardia sp. NPDC050717]|uniref:DUF4192 domain-containing protein n=1 Tax=Nocardia sp. NPDC050717 TaxID=3157221 RepID=UPI00340B6537
MNASHVSPGSTTTSGADGSDTPVRVDTVGALIAALPAMLGFVPTQSLVVAIATASPRSARPGSLALGEVIRLDLDAAADPAHATEVVELIESACRAQESTQIFAVIIDDRPAADQTARHALATLHQTTVRVRRAWLVPTVSTGATFHDLLEPGHHGLVDDPHSSPVTLARLLDGHQVHQSRTDLEDLIAVDPFTCARIATLLESATRRFHDELDAATAAGESQAYRRAVAETVLAHIVDAHPDPLAPQELATVAIALTDTVIRDVMLGLTGTPYGAPAQVLWLQLARATTGRARASAATLCAVDAYCRGDGVFAGICLQAAHRADPTSALTVTLLNSLTASGPPEQIRKLAEQARTVTTQLGIDLDLTG